MMPISCGDRCIVSCAQTVAAATVCTVLGHAGTYVLDVGAPGFETTRRTVSVRGTEGETCRCPTTTTERLAVSLAPTSAP